MKNGCDEHLEAKVAEQDERVRKLYRYVSDVARRVGEATTTSRSITDLFSTHLEVQRQKLRDNCEKLFFLDPLNHGKKSLELLWRKVYYETVSTAKKHHENDQENEPYLFTHIVSGIGNFHHFITRIQYEMKVDVKELDYVPLYNDEDSFENNIQVNSSDDVLQFGRSAVHSCLIYLGDLSRYQSELFHTFDHSVAARYYLQAAHVDMSSGMPFNQLGNLYQDKNYNLDSVCYYIHCLSCASPFEGAMGNLTKIFEKNSEHNPETNEGTMSQTEHLQNTIANFLSLIEIWYLGKDDSDIPQKCGVIAQELKVAMDFVATPLPDINKNFDDYTQAIEEEGINPSYLNGNLVHNVVQICLFTMSKMNEVDEQQAFACKAFTLALLSQLLQKLLKQLLSFGFKNPARKYKPKENSFSENYESEKEEHHELTNGEEKDNCDTPEVEYVNGKETEDEEKPATNEDNKIQQNGDAKIAAMKKTAAKRRRRRRTASSESSEMSDVDTESSEVEQSEESEQSGDEQLSDSTYNSDNDSKSDRSFYDDENSETEHKDEVLQNGDVDTNKSGTETLIRQRKTIQLQKEETHSSEEHKLNEVEIQNFLLGDNFLASTKLLQDWILTEKDLILSCGDSGESLFQCVVDLLNIFNYYFSPKNNDNSPIEDCKIISYAKEISKCLKLEYKTIPLPEDILLRGTNICKLDKDAAEWQLLDRYKPSPYEENVVRILNFIDFGYQIAKIVPRIRYNRSMKIFYLKKTSRPKLSTKTNHHKRTREWHNSKNPAEGGAGAGGGALLRRLGRLWLTARVRELERGAARAAPALLALDTGALLHHLRRVKQLLRARAFLLLVPAVVLQELDEQKRASSAARDAIRWLESALRGGARGLRAQRPGQTRALPLQLPRKAPPRVRNLAQVLEFCHHFAAEERAAGGGEPDAVLVLLLGEEPPAPEFGLAAAARAAGVALEHIDAFYARWRRTLPRGGKKR